MEVYIICCILRKFLENFRSWDMCQNVLSQSDCKIFKVTMSLEPEDENSNFWHVDTNS